MSDDTMTSAQTARGEGGNVAEIKQIDPRALATLTTGIVLVESFSLAHEAAEWVLGHPVWTHEFIDPQIKQALIDGILEQYPDIPTSLVVPWNIAAASLIKRYGSTVPVRKGLRNRDDDPVSSLESSLARAQATPRVLGRAG